MKTEEETKDKIFKYDAKMIVDTIFDNKLFKDHLTRDDMTALEDLICICMGSKFESHFRLVELCEKINNSTPDEDHK